MTTYPPGDWRNNPARTKEEKRLAILSDQSVRLDAPAGFAFLSAKSAVHLAANAYWDGSKWNRYDTTQAAALWDVQPDTGLAALFTVGPGANPIVWGAGTNFGADSGWLAPAFNANWSNFGAPEAVVGYKKDATGRVWLKGLAKKAVALVASDALFRLPAGYAPANEHIFVAASAGGYTELRVNSAGDVYIQAGGSATWTSLAGVSFDPGT